LVEVNFAKHGNKRPLKWERHAHICPPAFMDVGEFERDAEKLASLEGLEISGVNLFGGECLLHPQLNDLIRISRKTLPEMHMSMATNGLLLPQQPDTFWKTCAENNMHILVTPHISSTYAIHYSNG